MTNPRREPVYAWEHPSAPRNPHALRDRNEAILSAVAAGESPTRIAERLGMSRQRVAEIAKRERARTA